LKGRYNHPDRYQHNQGERDFVTVDSIYCAAVLAELQTGSEDRVLRCRKDEPLPDLKE
jgi:hypothetical protein